MKLSCAFSIVVLFVTGLNIPLVTSSTSSSAASSTQATSATTAAANTSTTTTAANTTAASTATTTTSQTTTAIKYVCIAHTCNVSGCLTNASNANSTGNCKDLFCTMVQRVNLNQTSYNITAGCASSCTQKDEVDGDFTVRTRCCQSPKCNNDDKQIVALTTKNGGSPSNQTPLWILSIMLFISAFEILL